MSGPDAVLKARDIVKYAYGIDGKRTRGSEVKLLSDASIILREGEIHALVGENGAGKSTLIKCLAGAIPIDGGSLEVAGQVAVIWQEFSLSPRLSVVENMFLGREIKRGPFLDKAAMRAKALEALAPLAPGLNPDVAVETLSTSQQQIVEIAKAMNEHARILILDEPTASLSRFETERLFELLRILRAEGIAIILVTHRFDEIFAMADTVTVLKDGRTVGRSAAADITSDELIELMVGRRLEAHYPKSNAQAGDVLLATVDLRVESQSPPVSLELRAGEIVGLVGLVGAGRTELARCIVGADRATSGSVMLGNLDISRLSLRQRLARGLGFVPEDRKTQGVIVELSVRRNLTISEWPRLGWGPFVSARAERAVSRQLVTRMGVIARTDEQPVSTLSGGNQQKVAFGKWFGRDRSVYVLDEPTRGVDVAARFALYEVMVGIAEQGGTVLMISSDLPEILNMSDRIYVMRAGGISDHMTRGEASEERILGSMFADSAGGD
jgi:ABC-type sugar transport system ATPase subunit